MVETRFDDLQLQDREFTLVRVGTNVVRGRLQVAQKQLLGLQADTEIASSPAQSRWLSAMIALVDFFITGEEAPRAKMIEDVRAVPFSLSVFRQFAKLSEVQEEDEIALQILDVARRRYPSSEATANAYEQLKFAIGDKVVPEVEIPLVQDGDRVDLDAEIREIAAKEEAPLGVLSAKQFMAQSSAMIEKESWSELATLLRDLRRARPTWAKGATKEINDREIALNIAQQNWPALVGNVRFLLDGSVPRALEVMGIVRDLELKHQRRAAELVLAEVERRHRDFPPAKQVRADWAEEARRDEANAKVEAELKSAEPVSP